MLVGDDPASSTYVANKMKAAQRVGITSRTEKLPSSTSESDILQKIKDLNDDNNVDGILVQVRSVPFFIDKDSDIILRSIFSNFSYPYLAT